MAPRQASLEVPPEAQGGGPATPRRPLNRVGHAQAVQPPASLRQGPAQGPEKPRRRARAPAKGDKELVERMALRVLGLLAEASTLTAVERRRVLERALRMVKRR